jgi:plastocyanin
MHSQPLLFAATIMFANPSQATVNGCDLATAVDATAQANSMIGFGVLALDYTPKCLKLSVGSQATFNGNFASHPLLGGELVNFVLILATNGPFVPVTNTGTTRSFTFNSVGTFPYYCTVHGDGGMNGAIFVVAPSEGFRDGFE